MSRLPSYALDREQLDPLPYVLQPAPGARRPSTLRGHIIAAAVGVAIAAAMLALGL